MEGTGGVDGLRHFMYLYIGKQELETGGQAAMTNRREIQEIRIPGREMHRAPRPKAMQQNQFARSVAGLVKGRKSCAESCWYASYLDFWASGERFMGNPFRCS